MENKLDAMPSKAVWDKVSDDYTIEINSDEKQYAEELYKLLIQENIFPDAKILELGSGSGHLSACLAQKGYKVSLLDFSRNALEKSKKTFEKYGLEGEFIEGDLFKLSDTLQGYDLVWNSGVMEHFGDQNLQLVFEQIASVMKDKFIFLVPNPDSISYLLMRYNLEGKGEWEYGKEYLRKNYLEIAKQAGLEGAIIGYAASSISVWHFESTFFGHENSTMYSSLIKDGIMPSNESYLVAYMLWKTEKSGEILKNKKREKSEIEKEDFFEKSAENYYLRKEVEKYKSLLEEYEKRIQDIQDENEGRKVQTGELNENNIRLKSLLETVQDEVKNLKIQIKNLEQDQKECNNAIAERENELKNKDSIIQEEKQQRRILEGQIVRASNEILPQILSSTANIHNILNAKWFSRFVALHAIMGALVAEPFFSKIKILVKLALRVVGIKRDFLIDGYRMNTKINQYLRNIDNIVQISKVNIMSSNEIPKIENKIEASLQEEIKECIYANEPLVSVLLPVFNHAEFIVDAIKGVQSQNYSNWELVILNDGSTDGLLEIVKDYNNDPRIKVYTQDNQRLPNGLSNLHNLAQGEFITWTSADNIMKEDMLKCLVEKLLATPNAVMVYGDVAIIDDKGDFKTTGYREMNRDPETLHIMRLPHCTDALDVEADNFINACFMYRKEPVRALKGLYSADLEGLEDYDFWLRLRTFGEIIHLKNKEPLYYYRVHENTMSEDLLKNKLEEHIKRTKKMIVYSQKKNLFSEQNWEIKIDDKSEEAKEFKKSLIKTNYNYEHSSIKKVSFISKSNLDNLSEKEFAIIRDGEFYRIYIKLNGRLEERCSIYKGYTITPLAKKVRQTYINGLFWEYPVEFADMQVLGCHIDINGIDIEKTIEFINSNSNILYCFVSIPGTAKKEKEQQISAACKNVIFMGEQEIGKPIYLYASWDAMFIPPLKSAIDIMPLIILGWSIGKWILVEEKDMNKSFPLMSSYYYGESLLGIKRVEKIDEIEQMLDQYIIKYSPEGVIKTLIHFLNGIGQDILVERPDFKLVNKERKFPPQLVENEQTLLSKLNDGYVGIMVDSLDKGGLEQVVALLAQEFAKRQIDVRILCTGKGGRIAHELSEKGIEVIIFDGDEKKFSLYLKENRPLLINSHYAKKMLETIQKEKIPLVEVIHNMYVFQDDSFLRREKEISEKCTKLIAVSSIVKEVYQKKVNANIENKIAVIGNAADPRKVEGFCREYVRKILNIPKDSLVFINVSSVDSRKNQIGLLKAFEVFNQTIETNSYLILVGNTLSDYYNNVLEQYINTITCRGNIIKLAYHKNIGDLYKASDVFVMPSYFEGWSIAATEALYCGLPVIHTLCGSAKELVDDGKNGILISNPAGDISKYNVKELLDLMNGVNPKNSEELVSAMEQMENHIDEWRKRKGEIAGSSILKFNKNNMINQYIHVFEEILNQ